MEHVDVNHATGRNIPVIHCIRNAECTSDFAIGLMFAETRNIARAHAAIKGGSWRKDYVNSAYTTSMCEMTLGLVGLGTHPASWWPKGGGHRHEADSGLRSPTSPRRPWTHRACASPW